MWDMSPLHDQKPSRAKVEFEELDNGLTTGVRLMPLDKIEVTESIIHTWPNIFYTNVDLEHFTEEGTFCLGIETVAKHVSDCQIWVPFAVGDVEECLPAESKEFNHTKKYRRFTQKFIVQLGKKAHVPYIQFYCRAKKAKYLDSYFKEGDLMTVIIKHPDYPSHHPTPPLICVVPSTDTTFVPMVAKQKLIVVTRDTEGEVDFKSRQNSSIHYSGTTNAIFGYKCHYFSCVKSSHWSEVIHVHKPNQSKPHRTITVPFIEKESRYPIILNPIKNSVIYAHNIDGFIIRFWRENHLPIVTSNNCPIKAGYVQESAQSIERRFEISKARPYFYLQKRDHSWIIR